MKANLKGKKDFLLPWIYFWLVGNSVGNWKTKNGKRASHIA
jgi:hypothetical protein